MKKNKSKLTIVLILLFELLFLPVSQQAVADASLADFSAAIQNASQGGAVTPTNNNTNATTAAGVGVANSNPITAVVVDSHNTSTTTIPKPGATNAQGSFPNGSTMNNFIDPKLTPAGLSTLMFASDVCGVEWRSAGDEERMKPQKIEFGGVTALFVPKAGYHGNDDKPAPNGTVVNFTQVPWEKTYTCVGTIDVYPTSEVKDVTPAVLLNAASSALTSEMFGGHGPLWGFYAPSGLTFVTGSASDVSVWGLSTSASGTPGQTFLNGTIGYTNTDGMVVPVIRGHLMIVVLEEISPQAGGKNLANLARLINQDIQQRK